MAIKEVWNRGSKSKRGELARALGYKKEWSKLKYDELGQRGGGMLQKDLQRLYEIRKLKRRRM